MTTVAGGLMFMMLGATDAPTLIAFAVLYGFFSGACKHDSKSIASVEIV